MSKSDRQLINEMLGTGGMAGGMGEEDDLGMGDEMDMGGDDLGLDVDDEDAGLDADMDMGDEMGGEMVEVDKGQLESVMQQVADGTMSVEDAMNECCPEMGGDDLDLGGDMDMGDEMGGDDLGGGLDMGGEEEDEAALADGVGMECENIDRIADLITDDPDIFN